MPTYQEMVSLHTWAFYTFLFVLPTVGVGLFLLILAMERYWAVWNAESIQIFMRLQAEKAIATARNETAHKKAAEEAWREQKAVEAGLPVQSKAEREQARSTEARKKALESLPPDQLKTIIRTVMASEMMGKQPAKK